MRNSMLPATPADRRRRQTSRAALALLLSMAMVLLGPATQKATAGPGDWLNPCNVPSARYVCDKAEQGAKYLYDKSGAHSIVDGVTSAVDFASDPFGYIEDKLAGAAAGLFQSFGEELTGKPADDPSSGGGA